MIHLLALGCLLAGAPDDKPRFDFFGTMDSLLVPGGKVAPVTKGVAFDIVLTDAGSKIVSTEFDLKPSGADKGFALTMPGLAFADGHLKGQADVKNDSGTSLQGVRLDIVGATETYNAKDDQGKEIQKTRPLMVAVPSPLMFGDIADGESNGQLPIDVSTLAFKPETVSIAIHGVVSGERFVRFMDLATISGNGQIDIDSKGRIYLADVVGTCVSRVNNDGSSPVQLCKLPDQCKGMALNPKTGDIATNCGNYPTMFFFDNDGTQKQKLADGVLDNWAGYQRYDANGRLWSSLSSTYWGFDANNKPNLKIDKLGDFDSTGEPFDVAPDGTMYACANADSVFVRHPDGKGGVFAKGNGDKLGQLFGSRGIRVGKDGLIYVIEDGANNVPICTISVFDSAGRVVRAFGRGAKKTMDNFPDGYWPSQLYRPCDLAFGPDGMIYVAAESTGGSGVRIMVYAPF